MSLVPDSTVGKIQFFASKVGPWAAAPASIGTTAGAVAALAAKVTAAQAKRAAQVAAQQAAMAATADLRLAVRDMADAGADVVKQIRAKAATDGDEVYVLAQIPPPARPSPVPPPGTPTGFAVTLLQDGSLRLRWRCANPAGSQGTIYQVARRTGLDGPFAAAGATGIKTFVDGTVPAGVAAVTYQVTAVRSTAFGPPAQFTVHFGVAPGSGAATAGVAMQVARRGRRAA